jgi:carbamoyltransferase
MGGGPFMLFVIPVHEDKRCRIRRHPRGRQRRVQTVRQEDNPRFHALLTAFDKITGVPVVLNTGFNIRGEPIVNTPADAVRSSWAQIDLLVLHDVVLEKRPEVAAALARERGVTAARGV